MVCGACELSRSCKTRSFGDAMVDVASATRRSARMEVSSLEDVILSLAGVDVMRIL